MHDPSNQSPALTPAVLAAVADVQVALEERARIDRALNQRRAELPDVTGLDAEAERLSRAAEADLALEEADAALTPGARRPPEAGQAHAAGKAAKVARQKHADAAAQAAAAGRTIAELERRAHDADKHISAAADRLRSASMAFLSGEAGEAWRRDYFAAAEALVRQMALAHWLGVALGGSHRLLQVDGGMIPSPDGPTPLLCDTRGSFLPDFRGAMGVLAQDPKVQGDRPVLYAPLIEARRQLQAHRPYAPPKPPAEPYQRRGRQGPYESQPSPADRANASGMRWGHLGRR